MRNRLAQETSPYLRQHQDNPVDWWPYSDEAFAVAKQSDRPILLSIGYSACHWCHVMAHESFEDETTAALMNERFVNIKVDREEMPDVDTIYQQALQLQGQHGGWPLTMFLTPEGLPYFGGTYFPKDERFGRPSFKRLLTSLSDAYHKQPEAIASNAAQFKDGLAKLQRHGRSESALEPGSVDRAADMLSMRIDRKEGGFEGAPKFPNPKALELILRGADRATRSGDPARARDAAELLSSVVLTLRKMAEGGIYDHLGGGFARYSTDAHWLVPHFEKMLYDNAQLLSLYADAYQLTNNPLFETVMRETAAYLERDLRAPEGGLYTAEDADSEGVEGKFYVWNPAELAQLLDEKSAALVARVYDVKEGGNWRDPHGHGPDNASILHVIGGPRDAEETKRLEDAKRILFDARKKRVRPGLDDKVLASCNGLAIAGLADAGRVLDDAQLVAAAERTAEFVLTQMRDQATGRLYRTWHSGKARLPGTLEDHAFMADGLLALYEATGKAHYLDEAYALTKLSVTLFYDATTHVFYLTGKDDIGLIERPASTHDGAIPSGMSVNLENLIRLGDLTGEDSWLTIAENVLKTHHNLARSNPFGYSNVLAALDLHERRPAQIVLAGKDTHALARAIARVYTPNRVIVRTEGAPNRLAQLIDGKLPIDGKPTAYVCKDFACDAPTTDAATLIKQLTT